MHSVSAQCKHPSITCANQSRPLGGQVATGIGLNVTVPVWVVAMVATLTGNALLIAIATNGDK